MVTTFIVLIAILSSALACFPPVHCQPPFQTQIQPQIQIQPPYQHQSPQPQLSSFAYPTQSTQTLNCIFTNDPSTATYDCSSTNTTIRTEGAGFNSLDGNHISNHSNYDVNGLKISSQVCHFMPARLSDFMPGLRKLEITYSGLQEIDELDTNGLRELQYLNLKGNRIVELGYRLFTNNPELVSIDFSDNFIKVVAEDILLPFDHLKFVNFDNNLCVKNAPAADNFREWDRELRRNCNPVDKYYGVSEPLWRIAENVNRVSGYGG
jgi:hypothetical protein